MKKLALSLSLFAAAATLCAQPGQSCGAFVASSEVANPPNIRLDRQSALLWQQGSQEHMLLSVQYSGGTDEFAWVIPVESRPEVTVEKGAPFTELRRATEIARPMVARSMAGGAKGGADESGVVVLEQKEEGPYNLAVLSATSGGGLYEWLNKNKFKVSKDARGQLDYYIGHKFVFVAARIRNGAKTNQTINDRLRSGTIAPMHLTFKARQLSYPLKMTGVNPGRSEMEIYVAGETWGPDKVLKHVNIPSMRGYRQMVAPQVFQLVPTGGGNFNVSGLPNLANPRGSFPTLARLLPKGGKLTKYNAVLDDSQRQDDLVFAQVNGGAQ